MELFLFLTTILQKFTLKSVVEIWASLVKCLPAMWETRVWSLCWENLLEKEMATHSSILAWRIPQTEEHGRLQSMGSQRVGHDWATSFHFTHCGWSKGHWNSPVVNGLCSVPSSYQLCFIPVWRMLDHLASSVMLSSTPSHLWHSSSASHHLFWECLL